MLRKQAGKNGATQIYDPEAEQPVDDWAEVKNDYKLKKIIGEGTFGQVRSAKCLKTGEYVAIKLIKNAFDDPFEARKTIREIEILKTLSTKKSNVFTTKLIDVIVPADKKQNNLFIVMQLAEKDLRSVLNDCSKGKIQLAEEHILTILYNLLCSMNYIHKAGVMHRDLKPGNILITKKCEIKICDFGLARSIPKEYRGENSVWERSKKLRESTIDYTLPESSKDRLLKELEMKLAVKKVLNENGEQVPTRKITQGVQSRWYRAPEVLIPVQLCLHCVGAANMWRHTDFDHFVLNVLTAHRDLQSGADTIFLGLRRACRGNQTEPER